MAGKENRTMNASFCAFYHVYDDYYFLNAKYFGFYLLVSDSNQALVFCLWKYNNFPLSCLK